MAEETEYAGELMRTPTPQDMMAKAAAYGRAIVPGLDVPKMMPVHRELMGMGSDLENLGASLKELDQRLCHVLAPAAPTPDGYGDSTEQRPPVSPIVSNLESYRFQLRNMTEGVRGILSRLEI